MPRLHEQPLNELGVSQRASLELLAQPEALRVWLGLGLGLGLG